MSARLKLNGVKLQGVLGFAAIFGALSGSWLIFLVTLGIGAAIAIHSGEVRLLESDVAIPRRIRAPRWHRR